MHCVEYRDDIEKWLSFRRLDDGWLLIQYDPKFMEEVLPDTPVWAIWKPDGKEHKHCFVVYGDPHVIYYEEGQVKKGTLDEVDFTKVAKFTLGNGDVLYFVGEQATNGNLSEVYIDSSARGSVFIWGKRATPDQDPELIGTIDNNGITFTKVQ